MNGSHEIQRAKMTKGFHSTSVVVPNSTMEQEPGQDDSLIRYSPSSPFVTMRHYISEFDPDESSTYMSMNALKLAESWKIYIDTFTDLCDIDKVPRDNRRRLLLLLAGNKLRKLLSHLESAAGTTTTTTTLEDTIRLLTQHFENRRAIQMSRFNFFYGSQNRRKSGESLTDWTSRLVTLTQNCQFSKDATDGMTVNDALMVVMYKHSQDGETGSKKNSSSKSDLPKLKSDIAVENGNEPIVDEEEEEEEEATMPVELQWGETEETVNPHRLKVEVVADQGQFHYSNGDRGQQQTQGSGGDNSQGENLTHGDMDLLRRAKGGPCICPNCTLFPKRRAGKHNCHILGCGREYSKTSHLRAHLVSHCNVLPFACSWVGCGKRFYRTDQLTRHARIHTGEKKFVCQFCEQAFSRSDHLTKHLKKHSNLVPPGSNPGHNISNSNAHNQNRANPGPATLTIVPNTSNNITAAMAAHQQMLTIPPLHYNLNLPVGHKSSAQFSYN